MSCFYHPGSKSIGSCERCNRPICSNCVITFKNKLQYIDRNQIREEKGVDYLRYEYDETEELNWCLPCYYTHFQNNLIKKGKKSSLLLSSVLETLLYSFSFLIILSSFSYMLKINVPIDVFTSSLSMLELMILLGIVVIILYLRKQKDINEKLSKVDTVKQKFFEITTIGAIDLPIECFYCKKELELQDMICLNIDCTLGEKVEGTKREIELEPVNSNYGLFDSLQPLPKFPDEEEE